MNADTPPTGSMRSREKVTVALDELQSAIVDCSQDAILIKNLCGIIQAWNPAAERLFGYAPAEIVGKSIRLLIPPDRIKEEAMILRRLHNGEPIKHFETIRRRKDGSSVEVSISITPVRGANGKIQGAAKIIHDISERKTAEAAIREHEQRLRAIVQTAVDAIVTIDERGIIESANPATERLFGYRLEEMVGKNVSMLMPQPFRREHNGYIEAFVRTGEARIIGIGREVTGLRKDGTTFPMSLSVSEVQLHEKRLFTGMIHDLTNRRQLEVQLLQAAANEQRRIGQDIHDGLCQDLIGLAFGAEMAGRRLAAAGSGEAATVQKLAASIREAAGQARQLSHGLNPVDLKAGGLPLALEGLADKIRESFHIRCAFRWDGKAQVHDDAAATHLYRIAQEAMSNSLKHGKARRIVIDLHAEDGRVMLIISDDGVGLPPKILAQRHIIGTEEGSPAGSTGIGVPGMRYRANLMGGLFDIRPGRDAGTVVSCSVPIHSKEVAPRKRREA
jgi:PAS domain S-box-containing protein